MDATLARKNPQKFIDYLSTSDKVIWHFINDPFWGYNIKSPPGWGWCGSVQANFFGSLMNDFPSYKHGDFRKLTFYLSSEDSHTVTWFDGIIIDTLYNLLICEGQRYCLTETPIVTPHEHMIQRYFFDKPVELSFCKVIVNCKSYKSSHFPPFLS
tara:strand:+ start:3004 stop:3468 length:465 start_codon:yes stop_codon:yes gene_type:complete